MSRSDKTDPRLDALQDVAYEEEDACFCGECGAAERWIKRLDAADREAGIVRVDTNDEALVERVTGDIGVMGAAKQMGRGALPEPTARNRREALVSAVLAALRESA